MPKNHLQNQNGQYRKDICKNLLVDIILKQDQSSGKLTRGRVKDILTNKPYHPRGQKVRLNINTNDKNRIGRVQYIIWDDALKNAKKIIIGKQGEKILGYNNTLKQIMKIKNYELDIQTQEGVRLDWKDIDNPQPLSIFQTILKDRRLRIEEKKNMKDKPRYCVIYVFNNKIIKFEYFEGRENLNLVFDFRKKELF